MSLHPTTGYVIDTEYTRHLYPEMFPRRLAYLCAIRGRRSVLQSPDAPFTYCDLGCGAGIGTAAMAAANPQGRFFGVDLNPAHIARGAAFAAAIRLAPGDATTHLKLANAFKDQGKFTEAVGDLYTSSLVALGLILFCITFVVLAIARYMLSRLQRQGR